MSTYAVCAASTSLFRERLISVDLSWLDLDSSGRPRNLSHASYLSFGLDSSTSPATSHHPSFVFQAFEPMTAMAGLSHQNTCA
jgi:hypothetical protein